MTWERRLRLLLQAAWQNSLFLQEFPSKGSGSIASPCLPCRPTRALSPGDREGQTEEEMTVNPIRTKLYAAICVLFGSAAVGTPWTSAQASDQTAPTKTVKFADLDIQTPEGAK